MIILSECFAKGCENEATTEFCPECLAEGGFKPKDYINAQLDNIYSYHAPKGDQTARYEAIRGKAKELAHMIDELCPNSREKSLAQTNLEQSTMWANASIARNGEKKGTLGLKSVSINGTAIISESVNESIAKLINASLSNGLTNSALR